MSPTQLTPVLRHIRQLAADQPPSDHDLLRRFAERRDQAAFAALVQRHGRMVFAVCRQVLQHTQDAEDAFQATFLVLAQHGAAIRKTGAVGSFLHGVAFRTAMKAKRTAARRHKREAQHQRPESLPPDPAWPEVQAVLQEEIDKLPDKLRAPFVLCCLEGMSKPEAAAELGWKEGTVSGRLALARKALQGRLAGRGITLAAVLAALAVSQSAKAAVPRGLLQSTLRAAVHGTAAAGITAHVTALVRGVSQTMLLNKFKFVTVLALAASLAVAGLIGHQVLAGKQASPPPAARDQQPAPPTPKAQVPEGDATFQGKVVDPDGQPVAGAKVYLLYDTPKRLPIPVRATSDADGRFRFSVPKKDFDRSYSAEPWEKATMVALADGFGVAMLTSQRDEKMPEDVTLRLVRDDVPLKGRVLDLQGQPVSGMTVRVTGLSGLIKGDMKAFETALKERKEAYPVLREFTWGGLSGAWVGHDLGSILPAATTDAEGRFQLKSLGRDRIVELRLEGPTVETKDVYARTSAGDTIQLKGYLTGVDDMLTFYPTPFDHIAPPCKPIIGVVRDKDTGKPIPGAVVTSYKRANSRISARTDLQTVADKEGRFKLTGMPKGEGNEIEARGPDSEPYLWAVADVPDTQGVQPVTVDFDLKRGLWVAGRVVDKVTGKPVHAHVEYFVYADNPFRKQAAGLSVDGYLENDAVDGTFRLPALPGLGMIAVRAKGDRYVVGVGADKLQIKEENDHFHTYPHYAITSGYHTFHEIDPKEGAEKLDCEIVVDPGKTLTGTVLGPDGKPLAGALAYGQASYGGSYWEHTPLGGAEFKVSGMLPGAKRLLIFFQPGQNLGGSMVVKAEDQEPLTVKLGPAATVTGVLHDADGRLLRNVELASLHAQGDDTAVGSAPAHRVRVDKDGKFKIEGLVPGLKYRFGALTEGYLFVGNLPELEVKAGENRDLGDLTIKAPE